MSTALLISAMIIVAYLLGSISSAILVCRLKGLPDPRSEGSKNPGATNVLRIGGVWAAALVFFFDMLKGALPAYGAYLLGIHGFWLGIVAISACIGHMFPIFFQFKGGKGVATALGAMASISYMAVSLMSTWLLVVLISRYSSLAALITCLLAPFYTLWFDSRFILPVSMLSLLIIWRHKDNILRLVRGEEPKIFGNKKR
ncbi:glycerol-3-phosphate 1-O-acyltransferase PlsY [Shewanella avicenniae]|uniref:Glycerol-3-phosphate acyltransferase n=1 Tax=Shewanella avicenniae TaxID=2814294 RepID=A0ABX7QT55_9GAMM|nr:glycerol-3-phosphate 1-O-acyltransferase PlsY [Shewanella avicenniae]QSX34666.1 glycerol-3-phosphate 1-O-acyltransferase PlsY [Shewanella avicenniae]